MWKNPTWIAHEFSREYWEHIHNPTITPSNNLQEDKSGAEISDALNLLIKTYNEINLIVKKSSSEKEFVTLASQVVISLAQKIEREKSYNLIAELIRTKDSLQGENDKRWLFFWKICEIIRLLLGSEEYCLVGTRNNRAAFKRYNTPVKSLKTALSQLHHTRLSKDFIGLEYIDQTDIDFIVEPSCLPMEEVMTKVYQKCRSCKNSFEMYNLLEDAWYNQRYIINPEGVTVKLNNFLPIYSITLKSKPGLNDPNFVDIIYYITTTGKDKIPGIIDGSKALSDKNSSLKHDSVSHLAAKIYHDFVTAEEIPILESAPQEIKIKPGFKVVPKNSSPAWIYIPRKIRNIYPHPIKNSDKNLSYTPRKISMPFPRKGNMTDKHREELRAWEEKTGMKVLHLEREGWTIVRPYVSPKGTDEGLLNRVPLFIKARMQQEIDQLQLELSKN